MRLVTEINKVAMPKTYLTTICIDRPKGVAHEFQCL